MSQSLLARSPHPRVPSTCVLGTEHYIKEETSSRLLSGQRGRRWHLYFWGWGQRQSGGRIHRHQVFSQQVVPGSTGLDSYTMRTWAGWPRGIAHSAGTDMNNRKERSLFPQLNILGPGPTEAVERSQYMTARSCPQFPHLKPKPLCTLV